MAALHPGPPRRKITIYGWSTKVERRPARKFGPSARERSATPPAARPLRALCTGPCRSPRGATKLADYLADHHRLPVSSRRARTVGKHGRGNLTRRG